MRNNRKALIILAFACAFTATPSITLQAAEQMVVAAEATAKQSADNSLEELSLSSGTLSPQFTGKTVKYTAQVTNDVTSVNVTAKPVHEKAVVESITGADNLQVGANEIKVNVKAENGALAVYTITVTRQEAGAGTDTGKDSQTNDTPVEPAQTDTSKPADAQTPEVGEDAKPSAEDGLADGTGDGQSEEQMDDADASNMEYLQEQYNEMSEQYSKEKRFSRNTIGILVFVIAVLIIVIINLLLHRNDRDDDIFPEEEEKKNKPQKRMAIKKTKADTRNHFVDDEDIVEEKEPIIEKEPIVEEDEPMEEEIWEDEEINPHKAKSKKGKKGGFLWKHMSDDLEDEEDDEEDEYIDEEEEEPLEDETSKKERARHARKAESKKNQESEKEDDDIEVLDLNDL